MSALVTAINAALGAVVGGFIKMHIAVMGVKNVMFELNDAVLYCFLRRDWSQSSAIKRNMHCGTEHT